MLSYKERLAKNIMANIVVPKLNEILIMKNPIEFAKWQGNCCLQTAFVSCVFLSELLPTYKWSMYEGLFTDILNGRNVHYNHSWTFGRSKNDEHLFVDLGRIHTTQLFFKTSDNNYPKEGEYKDLVEHKRTPYDYKKLLKINEYFTHEQGFKLINQIRKEINWPKIITNYKKICNMNIDELCELITNELCVLEFITFERLEEIIERFFLEHK